MPAGDGGHEGALSLVHDHPQPNAGSTAKVKRGPPKSPGIVPERGSRRFSQFYYILWFLVGSGVYRLALVYRLCIVRNDTRTSLIVNEKLGTYRCIAKFEVVGGIEVQTALGALGGGERAEENLGAIF